MEILLTLIYTALFIFLIHKMKFFNIPGISRVLMSAVFVLKIIFGLLLWAIYTFYYTDRSTADIFKYFDDSKIIFEALFTDPWSYVKMLFGIPGGDTESYYMRMNYWYRANENALFNDSHSIIRFNALVRVFSAGYYNVHTVFICFVSLVGLTGFYKAFVKEIKENQKEIFVVVFLLPSLLFWGSGVLKDGLLLFSFGMCFYFFIALVSNPTFNIKSAGLFIFFAFLLGISKPYIFITILPGLLAYYISKRSGDRRTGLIFCLVHLAFFVLVFNIHYVFPDYNAAEILFNKQADFLQLAQQAKPGSYIAINALEPNFMSLLKNTPQAIANTFFSPGILKARSPVILLAALENVLICISIVCAVNSFSPQKKANSLFYFSFFFVIITFSLIGLVTPIVGAIVRYKAIASMFLLIGLLTFFDRAVFLQRLSFLVNRIKRK